MKAAPNSLVGDYVEIYSFHFIIHGRLCAQA